MYRVLNSVAKAQNELEKIYPKLMSLRINVVVAMGMLNPSENKRIIFQELRHCGLLISSEVLKLKDKPKKSSKLSLYLKRVIILLQMIVEYLTQENQDEGYQMLALVCVHFINLTLGSSRATKKPPEIIAADLYSFLKSVFSVDLKYVENVLDVLICTFDEADASKSIMYHMLVNAMIDCLYTQKKSSFAKHLTIIALLSKRTDGQENEKLGNVVKQLDAYAESLPKVLLSFMEEEYGITFQDGNKGQRLLWKSLIEQINTKKMVDVIRKRLDVVTAVTEKPKKPKEIFIADVNDDVIKKLMESVNIFAKGTEEQSNAQKASSSKEARKHSSSDSEPDLEVVFEDINKKNVNVQKILSESKKEEERDFAEESEDEIMDKDDEGNDGGAITVSGSPSKIAITDKNIKSEEEETTAKTASPSNVDDNKRTTNPETVDSDGAPISKRSRPTSESNLPIKVLRKSLKKKKGRGKRFGGRKSARASTSTSAAFTSLPQNGPTELPEITTPEEQAAMVESLGTPKKERKPRKSVVVQESTRTPRATTLACRVAKE